MPARPIKIYQVLPYSVDFKAPVELWNPLSNTVFSNKYSFNWNKKHSETADLHA